MTNDPAQVHIGGEVSSESDWCDFGSIGGCESLEDTPWYTTEDVAGKKHLNVVGEKVDEDEADDQEQGAHHGLPVANSLREDTVDEETDD